MDIYFSVNNRAEVIRLPVVPSELSITSPFGNQKFNTANQGEFNLIGTRGIQSISWASFFPDKFYSFNRDRTYRGMQYIKKLENWRDRKIPIRLVITGMDVNIAVLVDNITYGPKDGTTDIYYEIQLSEFKFLSVKGV